MKLTKFFFCYLLGLASGAIVISMDNPAYTPSIYSIWSFQEEMASDMLTTTLTLTGHHDHGLTGKDNCIVQTNGNGAIDMAAGLQSLIMLKRGKEVKICLQGQRVQGQVLDGDLIVLVMINQAQSQVENCLLALQTASNLGPSLEPAALLQLAKGLPENYCEGLTLVATQVTAMPMQRIDRTTFYDVNMQNSIFQLSNALQAAFEQQRQQQQLQRRPSVIQWPPRLLA